MKKYIIILICTAVISSCNTNTKDKIAGDPAKALDMAMKSPTTVQMIDTMYNFGKVTEGEKVTYNYRFKNTGSKPLVIGKPFASCGCTVPESPKEPILPGQTGYIKVVFNSSGKGGIVRKTVTVPSNAEPVFPELVLTGEVIHAAK